MGHRDVHSNTRVRGVVMRDMVVCTGIYVYIMGKNIWVGGRTPDNRWRGQMENFENLGGMYGQNVKNFS